MNSPVRRTHRLAAARRALALLALLTLAVPLGLFGGARPARAAEFTITVGTTEDLANNCAVPTAVIPCSLRWAIHGANLRAGGDHTTVILPAGVYTLARARAVPVSDDTDLTGDLDIYANKHVTIRGAGAATTIIDGAALDRVLDIAQGATVELDGVTIRNGRTEGFAEEGGGIRNGGSLSVTRSTISGNAASFGGGIASADATSVPFLAIDNSTISGNTAAYSGGGLSAYISRVTLTNSTVSGNTATEDGGGILSSSAAVAIVITHATITGNRATSRNGGGGISLRLSNGSLANSLIAGNGNGGDSARSDCLSLGSTTGFISLGGNIFSDTAECPADGRTTATPDTILAPALADNGGPTRTHALLPGSTALNRVPPGAACPATDQRGVARPQGASCDAGAYEFVVPTPGSPPVFEDVPPGDPAAVAIGELARRGIVNGCDSAATPPHFCPAATTRRHELAALIVRAMPGWGAETGLPTFTDNTDDIELMTRVATLQRHGVVNGYNDCLAQGKAAPCYGPLDPVLRAQALSFVTRAMVKRGYWMQQPTDPTLYGGALLGTGHEQDASTYWYYTRARGGVPDYPEAGAFPLGEAAPRAWFARLLWTAIQGSPAAP